MGARPPVPEVTLCLDTNFVQALLQTQHVHHGRSIDVLVQHADAPIRICPLVFSEALCIPEMTLSSLNLFLEDFGIEVDWLIPEEVWVEAGLARATHLRYRADPNSRKRLIADFVIGAHALVRGFKLCTFDPKGFRTAFPNLALIL
jgi:predicted nucleic acid-binding protein